MDVESVRNNHDAAASNEEYVFLTIRLHSVESWVVFSLESCLESFPVGYLVTLLVFFFVVVVVVFFLLLFSIFILNSFLVFFFWRLGFLSFVPFKFLKRRLFFCRVRILYY